MTIKERVANGMAHMDRVAPGWWKNINLKRLNIGSGYCCVLGQTYGHYQTGMDKGKVNRLSWRLFRWFHVADADHARAFQLGFHDAEARFTGLNKAWKKAIAKRQKQQAYSIAA